MTEFPMQKPRRNVKQGNKRLSILADYLSNLPPENPFEMSYWARSITPEGQVECGSPACAVGYASCVPEFKALGFHLELRMADEMSGVPCFDTWVGFEAVEVFFSLTNGQAGYLFTAGSYMNISPAQPATASIPIRERVVNRIREFLITGNLNYDS